MGVKIVLPHGSICPEGTWGVDGETLRSANLGEALETVENVTTTLSQALTPQLDGKVDPQDERTE